MRRNPTGNTCAAAFLLSSFAIFCLIKRSLAMGNATVKNPQSDSFAPPSTATSVAIGDGEAGTAGANDARDYHQEMRAAAAREARITELREQIQGPVSYTHLTLPTKA